jgi:ABC-2 type transport system permease protein
MTRLLRAELRRLLARRLVRATAVFVLLAIVGGGALAFTRTHALPNAAFERRLHEATVERHAQNERARQCLAAHGVTDNKDISDSLARACLPDEIVVHDPRFDSYRLKGILQGSAGVLAIIGWALGASLVGAEFTSRSMTTMLTWETRRLRLIRSKVAVVVASVFVLAVLVLAAVGASMLPAMLLHGAPAHAGDPTFATYAGIVWRGSLLAAIAAAMGFAIATLGRNTAAALGVGFAYIIVLENIVGDALRNWRRWLLLGNAIVFVSGSNGGADIPGRSVIGAGAFLAAVALALLVGAASTFKVRDIA